MKQSLFLAFALLTVSAAAQEPDWSTVAVADIEAAYAETRANHPGMHDPANPGFPAKLDEARRQALATARNATSAKGFEASIQRFSAILDDGHAGAYAVLPDAYASTGRWPGFVAAWRDDGLYVFRSREGGPAAGSQIESCDGEPVPALVRKQVFTFRVGSSVPGNWWTAARLLFVDTGNPFVTLPQSCRFVIGGAAEDRRLDWYPVDDDYRAWRDISTNGDRLPIGMHEPAAGIRWIAMPDFEPDESGVTAYRTLFADMTKAQADRAKAPRAIVLDLRHNQGGSSYWSRAIAELLWGKGLVDRTMSAYFARTKVWWRPTPGNLAELHQTVALYEREGNPDEAARYRALIVRVAAAIKRGETYMVEADGDPAGPDAQQEPGNGLAAQVYVVVPGQCASACLDAIDVFTRFTNVKLIGAPSSADSTYMEVRTPALPSGMAFGLIPMKMYVDRPRGNGEFYTPDIVMRDFDWSTKSFLRRIEEDLAER